MSQALSPEFQSARRKAFWRLLPVLFISYMVAYIDRVNVAVAKLGMAKDLPAFGEEVFGFGQTMFFLGYFLLEVPGSLMVERWSARKWISRIMISWGLMAALTAFVSTPKEFWTVRFLLGLAEAGFFPGVIVYLTHWFTSRDRAKALSIFLVATPFAQMLAPISVQLLDIGRSPENPALLGMVGWQWVYVLWALPALVLGVAVLWLLTDKPHQASWLTQGEAQALEAELERERVEQARGRRMTLGQAFSHPKVLLLCLAYFCITTCSHSMELFMPSVLKDWYAVTKDNFKWLIVLPPLLALVGQLLGGWSSDRFGERRLHASVPLMWGAAAMLMAPFTQGSLMATMTCLMLAFAGFKTYMPAFWSLPSLFLIKSAAAGSIGLINSVGNLGGAFGPWMVGRIRDTTQSYAGGFYFMGVSMALAAVIVLSLGLGKRSSTGS